MREITVLPDFERGSISCPAIPIFRERTDIEAHLNRDVSPEEAVRLLETMLYIRVFEEMIIKLKGGKFVPHKGFQFIGATHLSIGQEAVAAGTMSVLEPDDYITSTHRGHGHSIGKGLYYLFSSRQNFLLARLTHQTRFFSWNTRTWGENYLIEF